MLFAPSAIETQHSATTTVPAGRPRVGTSAMAVCIPYHSGVPQSLRCSPSLRFYTNSQQESQKHTSTIVNRGHLDINFGRLMSNIFTEWSMLQLASCSQLLAAPLSCDLSLLSSWKPANPRTGLNFTLFTVK